MSRKPNTSVRFLNIHPQVVPADLLCFLQDHRDIIPKCLSVVPASSEDNAMSMGVGTFRSEQDVRNVLQLNNKEFRGLNVGIDDEFFGLTILAAPTKAELDIVALHGLNGHAYKTWVNHDDDEKSDKAGVMWLRDFLPRKLPNARIMTYGYNSLILSPKSSEGSVKDFAYDLLQRLSDLRSTARDKERPIIFVCHSLGGIVIKQALIIANEEEVKYPYIFRSTHSVMFLGTPHSGSRIADIGSIVSTIAKLALPTQKLSTRLLKALKMDSKSLENIADKFGRLHTRINIVSFYERRATRMLRTLIVDEHSALLGTREERIIPLDATHSGICKFSGPAHPLFTPVLAQLEKLSANAVHDKYKDTANLGVIDLMEPKHEPKKKSRDWLFVVPVEENPKYLGRTDELSILKQYFSNTDARVAIYGVGGVGKTQLATRFAYQSRKFSGKSVFWVSAESKETLESGFEAVATSLHHTSSTKRNEKTTEDHIVSTSSNFEPRSVAVQAVHKWMAEADDWLLVLDNWDDSGLDMKPYFPKGKGHILITTRDRRIVGNIASHVIQLTEMSSADAQRLFLRLQSPDDEYWRSHEGHPEHGDLVHLVQELACFPLALDQAAAFIRENGPMTIKEYLELLTPRSTDRELLLRFKEKNPAYPESVMTTWEVSFRHINETNPRALMLLQLLGFFSASEISEEMLSATLETNHWSVGEAMFERKLTPDHLTMLSFLKKDAGFRLAVGTLVSLSMVKRSVGYSLAQGRGAAPFLSVHPLVHEWVRVRLNSDPQKQALLATLALLVIYQSFPLEFINSLYPTMLHSYSTVQSCAVLHLNTVAANFYEYAPHASSLSVEWCSLALATNPLKFIPKGKEGVLLKRLVKHQHLVPVMEALFQLLALTPSMFFVDSFHFAAIPRKQFSEAAHRIVHTFDRNLFNLSCDESDTVLLMVLTFCIVQIAEHWDYQDEPSGAIGDLVGILREHESKRSREWPDKKAPSHTYTTKLLNSFRYTLTGEERKRSAIHFTRLFIDYRRACVLTAEEYWEGSITSFTTVCQDDWKILDKLSRGQYLGLCAKLYWKRPSGRDYDTLLKLFKIALDECQASITASADIALGEAFSRHTYISNSFGRTVNTDDVPRNSAETFHAFSYILRLLVPALESLIQYSEKSSTSSRMMLPFGKMLLLKLQTLAQARPYYQPSHLHLILLKFHIALGESDIAFTKLIKLFGLESIVRSDKDNIQSLWQLERGAKFRINKHFGVRIRSEASTRQRFPRVEEIISHFRNIERSPSKAQFQKTITIRELERRFPGLFLPDFDTLFAQLLDLLQSSQSLSNEVIAPLRTRHSELASYGIKARYYEQQLEWLQGLRERTKDSDGVDTSILQDEQMYRELLSSDGQFILGPQLPSSQQGSSALSQHLREVGIALSRVKQIERERTQKEEAEFTPYQSLPRPREERASGCSSNYALSEFEELLEQERQEHDYEYRVQLLELLYIVAANSKEIGESKFTHNYDSDEVASEEYTAKIQSIPIHTTGIDNRSRENWDPLYSNLTTYDSDEVASDEVASEEYTAKIQSIPIPTTGIDNRSGSIIFEFDEI